MNSYWIAARNGSSEYDRAKELKDFDETKAGVKGLVDAGVVKIPQIFVTPPDESYQEMPDSKVTHFKFPVIDLEDIMKDGVRRKVVVDEVKSAAQTWGFFQVLNHGIPPDVMDEMIRGVCRFHEQPKELKMEFYTRDRTSKVRYDSNFDLYKAKVANWRDTLACIMAPNPPSIEKYPAACRDIMIEYSKHIQKLGHTLLGLLSEALGLHPDHLNDIGCGSGHFLSCHYYPACPEPKQAIGFTKHSDPNFFTILLRNQIDGLQVLHQNHWVDVPPNSETLLVNVGDLLQIISNEQFKSIEHRVLANGDGPRASVACFFTTQFEPTNKLYGPLKELLSNESPPLYREILVRDYVDSSFTEGLGGMIHPLDRLRL